MLEQLRSATIQQMSLRLFIDEVGNSDLDSAATDPNVRYLALTGLIMTRSAHDNIVTPRLDAVKALIPGHERDNPLILHRREIVRREGRFAPLRDPAVSLAFDNGLIDLLHTSPYLVITVQIDKKLHWETYGVWHFDPYHYCLRCLVERYILYLRRHDRQGDVAIEPRYKKADKKLKISFERIYHGGTEHVTARIVQAHLLSRDIQFFQKSANIAGLQIADIAAHPSARHMRFARDQITTPNDFGGRIASILVERRYARNPKTMEIDGWGTKWLP